jgi:hypothetical protein
MKNVHKVHSAVLVFFPFVVQGSPKLSLSGNLSVSHFTGSTSPSPTMTSSAERDESLLSTEET